jgi:hypothetical protein
MRWQQLLLLLSWTSECGCSAICPEGNACSVSGYILKVCHKQCSTCVIRHSSPGFSDAPAYCGSHGCWTGESWCQKQRLLKYVHCCATCVCAGAAGFRCCWVLVRRHRPTLGPWWCWAANKRQRCVHCCVKHCTAAAAAAAAGAAAAARESVCNVLTGSQRGCGYVCCCFSCCSQWALIQSIWSTGISTNAVLSNVVCSIPL